MTNLDRQFDHTSPAELRHIGGISRRFTALALADAVLTAPRVVLTRAEQLAAEVTRREGTRVQAATDLAAKVANGTSTIDAAVTNLATVQAQNAATDAVKAMLSEAARLAETAAVNAFAGVGTDLIKALDTEARRIATEAGLSTDAVANVADSQAAMNAGPTTAAAWAKLSALAARLDEVRDLADTLRGYRIAKLGSATSVVTITGRDAGSASTTEVKVYPLARELHFDNAPQSTVRGGNDVKQLIAELIYGPAEKDFTAWAASYIKPIPA